MISKEIYEEVFHSGPDAIVVVNTAGQIIMTNNRVKQVFGYSKDELRGQMIETLIPDRLKPSHVNHRDHYSRQPVARQMGSSQELVARKKDGSEFFVEISLSPIVIGGEKLVLAAIRDVTEKIQMNQRLQQSLATIEQKNKELEQFAYVASHDLKEPLQTIMSLVGLLSKEFDGHLNENASEYIRLITHTSERMSKLIKDLLDYSRVGQELTIEEVDCNKLVASVLSDMSAFIMRNNAVIETGDLPAVFSSPTELRQLFQNLISNAVKFQKPDVQPRVVIKAVLKGKQWQFSVSDNGIGIDKESQEKIFQIFTRLHSRAEYEGTGIGLAQCQKIIDTFGGRIWVESQPGSGSTFYFTLPQNQNIKT